MDEEILRFLGIKHPHLAYKSLKNLMSEFLWFRHHHFGTVESLDQYYKSMEEFQCDYNEHHFIFENFRYAGCDSTASWLDGAISDPDFFLWPGMRLCVESKLEYGGVSMFSTWRGKLFDVLLVEQWKSSGHFLGTVNTFPVELFYDCLFDQNHFFMAIIFTRFWKIRGKQQYQELLRCLDAPEFAPLIHQKYYDSRVITNILKEYLVYTPLS
jgi:hypothetical protein